mmetsp:Transcript_11715/g.30046  ORF Transcript_11715/g.30046 Transcript_11715/m.30046 type:complete len:85 (+) Transcript_11715:28-282(+)
MSDGHVGPSSAPSRMRTQQLQLKHTSHVQLHTPCGACRRRRSTTCSSRRIRTLHFADAPSGGRIRYMLAVQSATPLASLYLELT